jgi:hypothetical protein
MRALQGATLDLQVGQGAESDSLLLEVEEGAQQSGDALPPL